MPRRSRRYKKEESDQDEDQQEHHNHNNNHENNNNNDNEEDPIIEEEQRSSKKRKRKTKKTQVMTSSQQTDAQRRILRKNQRQLMDKITDATQDVSEKMGDVNSNVFQCVRDENNELWDKVRYTREAVLDGENVDMISARAARQVDQLISVPRYDANRLVQKLRSKCSLHTNSSSIFDWKTFGMEVGSCFNSLPSYCSFLNGPIDTSYTPKERKKPVRKVVEEDDAEEEEVDAVHQKSKSKDDNKLSAVEKQIKVLNKMLKHRDEEEKKKVHDLAETYVGKSHTQMDDTEKKKFMKRIKKSAALRPCAVQFVLNPNSFTQTVENIFGLSFLVKKGDAEVGVRKLNDCKQADLGTEPGPWVKKRKADNNNPQVQPSARQAIVSFTMQDWRDLKEAYSVSKGDIPHRGKSRQPRTSTI